MLGKRNKSEKGTRKWNKQDTRYAQTFQRKSEQSTAVLKVQGSGFNLDSVLVNSSEIVLVLINSKVIALLSPLELIEARCLRSSTSHHCTEFFVVDPPILFIPMILLLTNTVIII